MITLPKEKSQRDVAVLHRSVLLLLIWLWEQVLNLSLQIVLPPLPWQNIYRGDSKGWWRERPLPEAVNSSSEKTQLTQWGGLEGCLLLANLQACVYVAEEDPRDLSLCRQHCFLLCCLWTVCTKDAIKKGRRFTVPERNWLGFYNNPLLLLLFIELVTDYSKAF